MKIKGKSMALRVFCFYLLLLVAPPSRADDAAEKLLADSGAVAKSLQSMTARIDLTVQIPGQPLKRNVGSIRLMKPNYALLTLTGDYPLVTLASDGHSIYILSDPTKYSVTNTEAHGENIETPWWALPMRFFFTQSAKPFGPDSPPWTSSQQVGVETIGNETYNVIEIAGEKPRPYVGRLYFDDRKLLRRSVVTFGKGAGAAVFTAEIKDVGTVKRFRPAEFKFMAPANARLDTGAESRMLSVGQAGPDFSLPTPQGDIVTLADLRRGKKATLINFWFLACPPCREEFRLFQKLYADFKDSGLALVAINKVDDAAEIKTYIRETAVLFPIAMGERDVPGVLGNYHVEAYPSTYLLNAEGKIVYRSVGVHEAELLQALKELGLHK
jgi:peroxiredoxin/outer membrane lipoprotein-sorting protein